jgi:hypothetical protein
VGGGNNHWEKRDRMTTMTALPMDKEYVVMMTTTEAWHVFFLHCSGKGAGRGL